MTNEEAWNRIDAIIARHEIDDDYVTITSLLDYDALRLARKLLKQEHCEDAISRQAVLEVIRKCNCEGWVKAEIGAPIEALSPVTTAEKVAHWIVHPKGIYTHLVCSNCLSSAPYDCKTNYCPNCGRKMEEVEV